MSTSEENVTSNATTADDYEFSLEYTTSMLTHDIFFLMFTILIFCANIAIIVPIIKYRRLHTPENILLVNWAVANIGQTLISPIAFGILPLFLYLREPWIHCFVAHMSLNFYIAELSFPILICIDYCLAAYFPIASVKFRKWQNIRIGSIWSLYVILFVVSGVNCLNELAMFDLIIFACGIALEILILCLLVIVLHITYYVRKCMKKRQDQSRLSLFFPTMLLVIYLLIVFNVHLSSYIRHILTIFTECLLFSTALSNFILLYKYNSDFNACVTQWWKCTANRYQEEYTGDRVYHNDCTNVIFINGRSNNQTTQQSA